MKLRGSQIQEILEAFLDGYDSEEELAIMLRLGLDINLNEISDGGNLRQVVFDVISWAENQEVLEQLITSAVEDNPSNESLQGIASQFKLWKIETTEKDSTHASFENATEKPSVEINENSRKSLIPASVWIALIGAAATIIAAFVPYFLSNWSASDVGTPNFPTTETMNETSQNPPPTIQTPNPALINDNQDDNVAAITSQVPTLIAGIGLLHVGPQGPSCTAWLVSPHHLLTADYCVRQNPGEVFVQLGYFSQDSEFVRYDVNPVPLEINDALGYQILEIQEDVSSDFTPIPMGSISSGQQSLTKEDKIKLLHHFEGQELVIDNTCRVLSVQRRTFVHNCDSGPGSGGGLLFSNDNAHVLGLQIANREGEREATRFDAIFNSSKVLQSIKNE